MGQITVSAWGRQVTVEFPGDLDGITPVAFAKQYDYEETLVDDDGNETPNPDSIEDFTIIKIFEYICDVVRAYEVSTSVETAKEITIQDIEAKFATIDLKIEEN
jgi:hypothetical protein